MSTPQQRRIAISPSLSKKTKKTERETIEGTGSVKNSIRVARNSEKEKY